MEDFKISLAAARVNAELTQDYVASALHISKNTLVNWEKGRTKPPTLYLKALLELYGVKAKNIFLP